MKIKPKQLPILIPSVVPFTNLEEVSLFVEKFNQLIHGRNKLKFENLGMLQGQYMVLLYITRNSEFQSIRNEFKELIEQEEVNK